MNNIPTISIVTPSFNQGEFIEETIVSVVSQEGDFFLDYIVMDGGSKDNSVEIIKKYEQILKKGEWKVNCRGIHYRWTSQKDKGQSDAINHGFHRASGQIFGWLNSDDVYYPGALQSVAKVDWEKTDFCYGEGMWILHDARDLGLYPTFPPDKYSLYFQCTLCQPTVFFSRNAWQELGDFSLDYHCVFDFEYWMRAVFGGKHFRFIPKLLAKSRMYPENKSLSGQHIVGKERANLLATYYAKEHLSKFRLFLYKRKVDRPTHRRVKMLFSKLNETVKK